MKLLDSLCEVHQSSVRFSKIWIFSKYFHLSVQYKISRISFQLEMRWCMQTYGRTWSTITFIPTMPTHIKKACRTLGNLQDRILFAWNSWSVEKHFIFSPSTKGHHKYLHLPLTCHFVPSKAIVYISSRHFNELPKRHYRAALKITSLSHNISYFGSLLLLRTLKETVQSVATFKCVIRLK